MGTLVTGVEILPLEITVTAHNTGLIAGRNVILKETDGWHNGPGVRRDKTPRLWAHGSFTERGWRESRLVSLTGHAWGATRAEAAQIVDDLAASLAEGTPGRFTFIDPDHGTRWAQVVIASEPKVVWDQNLDVSFQLFLEAADPRKYGELVSDVTGVPVDGGGLGFDLFTQGTAGVLDFGEPGDSGVIDLMNTGTADTGPVFTFTAVYAPEGFTILNRATDARLIYNGPVTAGQVVRLDSNSGAVTVDGVDRSGLLVRREWERLGAGETGSWSLSAPESINAELLVEVIPAWW